jgi:DNA-binding NtrC family response regulator
MRNLLTAARRVAPHAVPVLITGETGTGKEVLARTIHELSPRAGKTFHAINCGAIAATLLESTLFGHEKGAFTGADRRRPGVFEQADGGTLLLDEVGELSAPAQATLLRIIETGKLMRLGGTDELLVDVRVLAATHRDLERMCAREEFRWDLLFRLNALVLEVAPLRDRTEEIEPLALRFLEEARRRVPEGPSRISPDALATLRAYRWPGNVRELRNVVERAVVMTTTAEIRVEDLPPRVRTPEATPAPKPVVEEEAAEGDLPARMAAYERRVILRALEQAGGKQTEAARLLGIPRRTLSAKAALHGLRKRYDPDR